MNRDKNKQLKPCLSPRLPRDKYFSFELIQVNWKKKIPTRYQNGIHFLLKNRVIKVGSVSTIQGLGTLAKEAEVSSK